MECDLSSLSGVDIIFSAELSSLASKMLTESYDLASADSKWTMFVTGIRCFQAFCKELHCTCNLGSEGLRSMSPVLEIKLVK